MANRLKRLQIKRVALVDEGANPDAFVRFAKAKDEQQIQSDVTERGIARRMLAAIAKALGIETEDIQKDARTFAETADVRNYDVVIDREIYPMQWALMDSIRSILIDTDIDDITKESLLKQTLNEYSEAYIRAVPFWAKAKLAKDSDDAETKSESVAIAVKMRDYLNEQIEKAGCGDDKKLKKEDDPDDDDEDDNDPDDDDGDNGEQKMPPVKKGVSDMKFDTSKMTPEEKATYEDLAKRYGKEETPPVPVVPAETEPTAGDDVNKGINPVVAAELESLRKFRDDMENKQYIEIAKKYTLLGKKPEELGPVLKSLKDAGGSAYDDMIGVLDSSLALVEKSGTFDEIGKRGHSTVDDAWGKIEAAAQEIIKSKPDMCYSDAIDAACNQHPELVEEYEKSRQ